MGSNTVKPRGDQPIITGLAIESSCDETSVALVRALPGPDGSSSLRVLDNQIYSQVSRHEQFGGIVPEVASREHLTRIHLLLENTRAILRSEGLSEADLSFVAVTNQPGLVGSLMVGVQVAKTLSALWNLPMVACHHLEAHLAVWLLDGLTKPFPALGLLVSGGNTALFDYRGVDDWEIIGQTSDDAVGEAYDKVAKLLGLGYPGGAIIEKTAAAYVPSPGEKSIFPSLLRGEPAESLRFSFSGLKTAVLRYTQFLAQKGESLPVEKICYYFQESVFELILRNLDRALGQKKYQTLIVGGGVSANRTLKGKIEALVKDHPSGIRLYYPSRMEYCTDNAAMIGALGFLRFERGLFSGPEMPISSSL